jgi:phosphatidylserine/phosphatidylglycerophosphate/cardiolipin synthase-like enzyme
LPTALLVIHALDIWAQPLPSDEASLTISESSRPLATAGFPILTLPLYDAASYDLTLSARDHHSLTLGLDFVGTVGFEAVKLRSGPEAQGHGRVLGHEWLTEGGRRIAVHHLFLGLRHRWFSAQGRPARRGNSVRLLMDGEEAWSTVQGELGAARESVLIATWWWQSDFELLRDPVRHLTLTPQERRQNTILGLLQAIPAQKRVLVNQFWSQDGFVSFLTIDDKLRAVAEDPNDGFEYLGQANETSGVFKFEVAPFFFGDRVRSSFPETSRQFFDPEAEIRSTVPPHLVDLTLWPIPLELNAASYHQKFMVLDWRVAFVGGMNVRPTDWDTSQHLVFDPRRMDFDATLEEREAVRDKEALPDNGPRKDYLVRIAGPAVQDVGDVFHRRWSHQLATRADYWQNASDFVVRRDQAPVPGGLQIQVTATLPQPFWEHAIAETWFNAAGNATEYILLEDQYFRIPMLNDALVERMTEVPGLRLVVITKPVSEWTDPGCPWTHASHQRFKTLFPDRYLTLQLRSFDYVVTWGFDETEERFADMDSHGKMLIVDDLFMSVGSANKNNRGIVYEGEMNVAILDPTWVRAARRRIFENLLPAGTPPTDVVSEWWDQLRQAADWNDYVYRNWDDEGGDIDLDGAPLPERYTPRGFLYSLDFGTVSDCLLESVGPDQT